MPDEKIDQKRPAHAENELKKMQQRLVDDTVDDSFPASDPPAWTTGGSKSVAARTETDRDEGNRDETAGESRARQLAEQALHVAQSALRTGERYLEEARRQWPQAERYYRQGRESLARPVETYPLAAVFLAAVAGYGLAMLIHGRSRSPQQVRRNMPAYGRRPRPGPFWDDETSHGSPDPCGARRQAMAASSAPSSY